MGSEGVGNFRQSKKLLKKPETQIFFLCLKKYGILALQAARGTVSPHPF